MDPLLRKGGSEDADPRFPNVDPRKNGQNEMDPKRCVGPCYELYGNGAVIEFKSQGAIFLRTRIFFSEKGQNITI